MTVFAVQDLRVRIGAAQILSGVSFSVKAGRTLGIVGESGSGKSMSVLAATGLVPSPPAMIGGRAVFDGQDLLSLPRSRLRSVHGAGIGFVFQDPSTSLNPLLTVERQISETLVEHRGMTRQSARERAGELLGMVGIPDPARRLDSYPHEMSGGMRQRVMIAIAISCEPRLLIADEPTTALDVTVQAQILDLVRSLQERLGLAVVWISHDLGVVGSIADDIVVMYAGQVVEQATAATLFHRHRHPYTEGLLASRPQLGRPQQRLSAIPGAPPDPARLPAGCLFYPRCSRRHDERCGTLRPDLVEVAPGHWVRSFYADPSAP